ncbi:MAG: DNA polymerase I [Spirochaetales bacterium]|nr:DNA polymerase I [Spirochaetales bacterium]
MSDTSKSTVKRVFIIDGYGQIYRSYFAFMNNPLKDRSGNNVSAVFGFFNTMMSLVRQYSPEYLVVAMDSRGKTFRHELYDQYKANREKAPEDLHAQVPVIDSFLDAMHIPHFERTGMEADDIIATISRKASSEGIQTVMVTGDKDLLQLVKGDVLALRPPRKGEKEYQMCGSDEVRAIFGVGPEQIIDYLTILGDSSDNVPGINGIGEKGAVKLLSEYGTLDNAYSNIGSLAKGVASKLEAARDHIGLSRTLVTLKDDVFDDSQIDFSDFRTSQIDWNEGVRVFREMGSETLAKAALRLVPAGRFELSSDNPEPKKAEEVPETKSEDVRLGSDELGAWLSKLPDGSDLAVELISGNPISVCLSSDGQRRMIAGLDESKAVLGAQLPRFRLIGQDLKEILKTLSKAGIGGLHPYADTMIASWMLNSSLTRFDPEDCCQSLRNMSVLEKKLSDLGLSELFHGMEMPLLEVLFNMEENGILLDVPKLEAFGNELEKEIAMVQEDIYMVCGKTFNLNSPKQLQEVLFVDRDLPTGKKTKSGFSTDSDVLEELSVSTDDPVPALLLRYRALSKLLSTYVQSLPTLIDGGTGRIHTTFLQTGTATGRLSSKNPNLQNIPIRTEEGRRIRDAFVPAPGCRLMSADYSQIELVVLSHVSGDINLRNAFIEGNDVHRETAARIYGIFPEMVTPDQRRAAKTINFGILYGMSAFRLAHDLKIPRKDAQKFIDTYFEQYSGISAFIEATKRKAKEDGFVRTEMGHIRYIPEIRSSNKPVLAAAERVAVNTVIQGTAAEIMKKAMIGIFAEMRKRKLKSRILLQVHDELIFEVPEEEISMMEALVRDCMENAVRLSVPLRVEVETGRSWGEMH